MNENETRLLGRVQAVLQSGPHHDRITVLSGQAVVFLDGDEVCTSVEVMVSPDWEVRVYDSGSGQASWLSERTEAPGADEWYAKSEEELTQALCESLFDGSLWTPWDRELSVEPVMMDGAQGWEVCLAPIGKYGHLLMPYIKPPARESL